MIIPPILSFTGTKINTIYYNDLHGNEKYVDSFLEERDKFYKSHKEGVNLTLSGGDAFSDTNVNNDYVAKNLISKTDAIAIGNHDIEGGFKYFSDMIKKFSMQGKWLGLNIFANGDPKPERGDIANSKVMFENGEKIGIIGVAPFDFKQVAFIQSFNRNIEVDSFEKTEQAVRKEVEKLERAKVDKIFLLAHTGIEGKNGEKYYERFANIGGIDVILGGHDHKEFEADYMTERNEPVKVVATGGSEEVKFHQNLNRYGELELEFDDNGILIQENCKNTFKDTPEPKFVKKDTTPVVGRIKTPMRGELNPMLGHSEIGNFVADACLDYAKRHGTEEPDFAIVNPGSIRSAFIKKKVTEKDVRTTTPFINTHLISAPLTKAQIVSTLDACAKTTANKRVSPGMIQVSGLEYSVDKNLDVQNIRVLNENGEVRFDMEDVPDDYSFRVVYDNFLASGGDGFTLLEKDVENDEDVECFHVPRQTALIEYLSDVKNIKNYTDERIHTI